MQGMPQGYGPAPGAQIEGSPVHQMQQQPPGPAQVSGYIPQQMYQQPGGQMQYGQVSKTLPKSHSLCWLTYFWKYMGPHFIIPHYFNCCFIVHLNWIWTMWAKTEYCKVS